MQVRVASTPGSFAGLPCDQPRPASERRGHIAASSAAMSQHDTFWGKGRGAGQGEMAFAFGRYPPPEFLPWELGDTVFLPGSPNTYRPQCLAETIR